MSRLLLVDDDVELSELVTEYLGGEGFELFQDPIAQTLTRERRFGLERTMD